MFGNKWSENEIQILKEKYPTTPSKDIAQLLNRSVQSIYGKAELLGLKKAPEFLNSPASGRLSTGDIRIGRSTTFKKGQIPFNKGLKIHEYMNEETIKKVSKTQFKKGSIPHNAANNWEERLLKDSDGRTYIRIKVPGYSKLIFKHIWLWMEKFGDIPTGHVIIFKDNNPLNCVIENLEAITRQQNMKRNSIVRFPQELRQVINILSKLNKKIKANEEQD